MKLSVDEAGLVQAEIKRRERVVPATQPDKELEIARAGARTTWVAAYATTAAAIIALVSAVLHR
jgi:hypothetical protein